MQLLQEHPKVAFRDCSHCLLWQYNEETGEVEHWRGKPLERAGKPPCRTSRGCAKGSPEDSKTLTRENTQALEHYLECQAVNRFPDDPIVRRNARAIQTAFNRVAENVARQQDIYYRSRIS